MGRVDPTSPSTQGSVLHLYLGEEPSPDSLSKPQNKRKEIGGSLLGSPLQPLLTTAGGRPSARLRAASRHPAASPASCQPCCFFSPCWSAHSQRPSCDCEEGEGRREPGEERGQGWRGDLHRRLRAATEAGSPTRGALGQVPASGRRDAPPHQHPSGGSSSLIP